jgi:hypothetical protein
MIASSALRSLRKTFLPPDCSCASGAWGCCRAEAACSRCSSTLSVLVTIILTPLRNLSNTNTDKSPRKKRVLESEEEHGGPLRRGCARRLHAGFRDRKGQQEISKKRRWGYALFNYEAASDKFTADPSPSDCGHACHVAVKAKGPHLPPVPEALNRTCPQHGVPGLHRGGAAQL